MARIIGEGGVQSDDSTGGGSSGMRTGGGGRVGGRKPSFKTRGSSGHGQHGRNIRATKVTLPASKVRELASKFNAVVVDSDIDSQALLNSPKKNSARGTSQSVNPPSSVVLATIQRFEGIIVDHKGVKGSERPKCVLVRTNSIAKERPQERLKNIPEIVPEEIKKNLEEETSIAHRHDETSCADRVETKSADISSSAPEDTTACEDSSKSAPDPPKKVHSTNSKEKPSVDKDAKPEIKPKPPDLLNFRGSLGNLNNKIAYKESYSKNNNRLSLPKVVTLDELLSDRDTKPQRPNSSFLWSAKMGIPVEPTDKPAIKSVEKPAIKSKEKPEVAPRQPVSRPEPKSESPVIDSNENALKPPSNETKETVQSNPSPSESPSVELDRASLVANKSSLYRHLGRSQENVSSLRRSHENIIGRSRESVASEGHSTREPSGLRISWHGDKVGSQNSLASGGTTGTASSNENLKESAINSNSLKDAAINNNMLNNRVSFHLPSEGIARKEKYVEEEKRLRRAPSIRSNASYEDIRPYLYEDMPENSYAVIADYDDTEAIYDDVLNVVSQAAAEGIYESIYSGEGPKDDSDSSLDHQNSLYDHRPASQASSGSGGRQSATAKSDTSDEWMDIELEDKDRKEEFILLEEKAKPKNLHDSWSQRVRRQWSHRIAEELKLSRVAVSSPSSVYLLGPDSDVKRPSYGELEGLKPTKGLVSLRDVIYFGDKYEDQEVTLHLRGEGEPSEDVYEAALYDESAILDDFDDSSDSDGEGGKSGGFDLVQPNDSKHEGGTNGGSGRESEGIYGLMMSAGKKVKKTSWSISQRLRRRMSKITIAVSNPPEPVNGADPSNQRRWPSFKKKSKGSTSKFYLDADPTALPEPASLPANGLPPVPATPLSTASLPLVLPPFKELKRPSLELPPSLPPSSVSSPSSGATSSLPLVLPPFKESRRSSPPLPSPPVNPQSTAKSSSPPPTDSRRLSTALPSAPRPTSPPPPPPPLVNGESKPAGPKSVNDPTLYVESGLFGSPPNSTQQNNIIKNNISNINGSNQATYETNSNHSGSSGKSQSNPQWYSDAGLYENTNSENGKTRRSGDEPLPDLPIRRVSNSSFYSDIGFNNKYAPSDDSGQGSQLDLQFADEPLYQFYAARVAELELGENNSDIGYEEIGPNADSSGQEIYSPSNGSTGSGSIRPSALDLVNPESIHRTLWCQVPQVINSGILESLTANQKRLQEAKFELISSEASYYKSLTVLERTFANSIAFKDETVIPKLDYKTLFGNIIPVRKCSESMLAGLEKCWQESVLLDGVCEVLLSVAKEKFFAYVRYCSHQVAIERTLKRLKKNPVFSEKLAALESSPACHSLSLSSFLLLPMQRVTRLPLLLDAIMTKLENGSSEFESCQAALMALNKVVHDCNEAARQTERLEEMGALSRALVFPKHLRPLPLMSASRWLVRSGQVIQYNPDTKLTFSKKLTAPRQIKLTLFLFTDVFFVTKKKGEDSFTVQTYCPRNFVQMSPVEDPLAVPGAPPTRFLLSIAILENHEGKHQDLIVSCNSESCRERWLQPFSRPTSEDPDEVLYETWDCPQVVASHAYPSSQPDELALQPGDVVNVLTKMADGWFYGERLRDSEKGWFPGNYVAEVASAHVRARNLRQRHRLLAISSSYILQRQQQS